MSDNTRPIDIKNMEEVELKALIFDMMEDIQRAEQNIRIVRAELEERRGRRRPAPVMPPTSDDPGE